MSSRRSPKPLSVTLVGERKETLSELHDYLVGAGVESRTCRSLRDAELPAQTAAVVLFPDEFEEHDVVGRIGKLRTRRPRVLLVLVTARAQRLRPALTVDTSRVLAPVVLAKPAFGWAILDAIREHVDEGAE